MKILRVLVAVLMAPGLFIEAQGGIFADDFELGRTCWVWSATVGGQELCFDMPYESPPPVGEGTVRFTTDFQRSDIVFAMDTTGSMGGEVGNLKASIESLVEAIQIQVPDSAFGVVGYEDYPYAPYGSWDDGDSAFYLLHRVMTVSTDPGLASIVAAVDAYQIRHGGDTPESGWEMVYQVATGVGSGSPPYGVPPFDPATAPPVSIPAGEEIGEYGGVGLRIGSMPILVWITDVASHNGRGVNDYGPIPGVTSATYSQAVSGMVQKRGRIIGIMSGEGARADLKWAALNTDTWVFPDAWGPDNRPPGCSMSECCTGIDGIGVPADGGQCPLVFEIAGDGSGLGTAVVDGIERLITSEVTDVSASIVDDPTDPVDAVDAFVDYLEAESGAPPPCAQGLVIIDYDADGVDDTFEDVPPGTSPCFNLVLKTNSSVPEIGEPQVFGATLEIWGDWVTVLGDRKVFFRVPP